jgi:hypothetical protein
MEAAGSSNPYKRNGPPSLAGRSDEVTTEQHPGYKTPRLMPIMPDANRA